MVPRLFDYSCGVTTSTGSAGFARAGATVFLAGTFLGAAFFAGAVLTGTFFTCFDAALAPALAGALAVVFAGALAGGSARAFAPALCNAATLAQRAFTAAVILARPSAEMLRFALLTGLAATLVAGTGFVVRPLFFATATESSASKPRAC